MSQPIPKRPNVNKNAGSGFSNIKTVDAKCAKEQTKEESSPFVLEWETKTAASSGPRCICACIHDVNSRLGLGGGLLFSFC